MTKPYAFVLVPLVLAFAPAMSWSDTPSVPESVVIHNGQVTLHAMLWRPQGTGLFPAVLLNHGSGRTPEQLERLGPYERFCQADGMQKRERIPCSGFGR